MKPSDEYEVVASNGDHAHACITVGGGTPMGTVTARIALGYVLLYETPNREVYEGREETTGLHRP